MINKKIVAPQNNEINLSFHNLMKLKKLFFSSEKNLTRLIEMFMSFIYYKYFFFRLVAMKDNT